MEKKEKIISRIKDIVFVFIVIFTLSKLYGLFRTYYFNGFTKAEYNSGQTTFSRDAKEKYSEAYSYKLESKTFNDAMFYKTIDVEPNTPYKISCMIKTENVEPNKVNTDAGAQICIVDTTNCSKIITGTNDWQKIEYIFTSNNETELKLGFRLGGNQGECKGTAWFSDFKLEKGMANTDNNWNFGCFIIKNVDINLPDKGEVQISMNQSDIETVKTNMERFKGACEELSNNKMQATYDIQEISEPLKTVTYSDEFGYYVDPSDVRDLLLDYIEKDNYDHIFVVVRLGEDEKEDVEIKDWIGLGGMDLQGIGFSNIRLPNSRKSYIYTYSPGINNFPEEVFVHEFLHSLEKILIDNKYNIPELHDYNKYGYKEKILVGLKQWYQDYMRCEVKDENGNYIGLNEKVYSLKPAHEDNFKYSIEIQFNDEPKNFIENIKMLIEGIGEQSKK